MKYNNLKGLMSSAMILVKRIQEESGEEYIHSLQRGYSHQYLCDKVDDYLKVNGIHADRKSINVLVDKGKELFINGIVNEILKIAEQAETEVH